MASPAGLPALSDLLWRERQLLGLLQFKLLEQQLLLEGGHERWLADAAREVDMVLDELARVELARALELAEIGPALGLGAAPALAELAAAAPSPWGLVLDEHLVALQTVAEEVGALAADNRGRLEGGLQEVRSLLQALAGDGAPWGEEMTG